MKKTIIVVVGFILLSALAWEIGRSAWVHQQWYNITKPDLPAAENVNTALVPGEVNANTQVNANVPTNTAPAAIPAEKNLAVPFTSQAPNANWDADHEEFCEEAAVLMAGRFFRGQKIVSAADAEAGLQQLKTWEVAHLGFYFDTTAAETAEMATGAYGVKVELKVNPTITDIKQAIADDKLVIVPSAGRQLGNPNFKAPGPIYHNLVIRGYTENGKFITNDPGTRKGEAYIYDQEVVMNAMHDWVPKGVRTTAANGDANGRKVILIISS